MSQQRFQQIWKTVQAIPPGTVASYSQVADLAGLPGRARLVGKALGKVPDDMQVPWYRVLRADGKIAFDPASEIAQRQKGLLQSEDVVVLNNRVKLARFQWQPDLGELMFKLQF